MNPKVLAAAAALISNYAAFTPADVEQFLGGFVFGLIQKDDLTQIEKCLNDASGLETEIEQAFGDFAKGDITDIIAGITLVGKILQELPTDLGDCQGMQGDIDRIEKWAAIFSDPSALVKVVTTNVIKNFSAISKEITQTMSDVGSGNMYNSGEDIADIMVLTLGAVPAGPEDLIITQW